MIVLEEEAIQEEMLMEDQQIQTIIIPDESFDMVRKRNLLIWNWNKL